MPIALVLGTSNSSCTWSTTGGPFVYILYYNITVGYKANSILTPHRQNYWPHPFRDVTSNFVFPVNTSMSLSITNAHIQFAKNDICWESNYITILLYRYM